MNLMLYRMMLLIVCSIFLLACTGESGIEESIKIYDPEQNAQFIQILDEKDVTYQIASDGQIFYPIEYRAEIKKAEEVIFGTIDQSVKGTSVRAINADAVASKLTSLKINFKMIPSGKSVTFTWDANVDEEAMSAVREVLVDMQKNLGT